MAALRAVSFQSSIPPLLSPLSSNRPKAFRVFFAHRNGGDKTSFAALRSSLHLSRTSSLRFVPFASEAEAIEVDSVVEESSDSVVESEDSLNDVPESDTSDASDDNVEEEAVSPVIASLESYKEALANGDESKVVEVTTFLKSLEDEKTSLQMKVVAISQELSAERDRVIRISADFDNFRKRTERERSSLMTNAQGEVVEKLLGVLDNFERAKEQIKVENEKEEKISNSYQSIYKQLSEILTSLGVASVETVGQPFDPLFHEAIMREDSSEFEEGIILQEFRKGFRIGERLLRPSMVKVSAGPGPAKAEEAVEEEKEGGTDESKSTDEESQGPESV